MALAIPIEYNPTSTAIPIAIVDFAAPLSVDFAAPFTTASFEQSNATSLIIVTAPLFDISLTHDAIACMTPKDCNRERRAGVNPASMTIRI